MLSRWKNCGNSLGNVCQQRWRLSLGWARHEEVIDLVSSGSLSAQDFVPALTTGLAQLGSDVDLSGSAADFRKFQAQLEEFMSRQLGGVLLPGVINALNILTKTMSNANLGNGRGV